MKNFFIKKLKEQFQFYPNNSFEFLFPRKFNNKRLVHYHIMKNAGTSINHFFYSLLYNKDFKNMDLEFSNNKNYLAEIFKNQNIGGKMYMFSNLKNGNIIGNNYVIARSKVVRKLNLFSYIHSHNLELKYLNDKNNFCFSVIREPGSRIVSLFKNFYQLKLNKSLSYYYSNIYKDFDDIEIYHNPNKFFDKIKSYKFLFNGQINTFSENLDMSEALKNIKKLDFLLDFSNLEKDFQSLLNKLKLEKTNISQANEIKNIQFDENILNELKVLFVKQNTVEVDFYKNVQSLKLNNFFK